MHCAGSAVPAGPAGLLVVGVEPGGHLVVQDEAGVGLVDAQAERVGRDHDACLARHERLLRLRARGRAELAVIEAGRRRRRLAQRGMQRLGGLDRGGVDEPGAVASGARSPPRGRSFSLSLVTWMTR